MGYLVRLGRGKMQGEVESHGVVLGAETLALTVKSPLGVKGTNCHFPLFAFSRETANQTS